jgi:hypothetical protein
MVSPARVGDDGVEIVIGEGLPRKRRHSPEAPAHLHADEESGKGLVVDRRAEPRLSSGMTCLAKIHEDLLSAT